MLELHTILVPRNRYTLTLAKKWIREHGYKVTYYGKKPHVTTNFIRFRQLKPREGANYVTKKLPNGIQFVYFKN